MSLIEHHIEAALARLPKRFHNALRETLTVNVKKHGNAETWDRVLAEIPEHSNSSTRLDHSSVSVTSTANVDVGELAQHLRQLMPWRKGPWHLLGVDIDTEWRSDWKWQRLLPHISPLVGRRVMDVGCGNGYHLFRMLGEQAELALGIDPTRLFLYQFLAVQKMMPANNAYLLPLRAEHLPAMAAFDTVFSMGVLYHRRSPLDHLSELLAQLRPGGELVLETLVVPGDAQSALVPQDRYAKMANVWFLPSAPALAQWLDRLGLEDIRIVDINRTSTEEQRQTPWMQFQSLSDFLMPGDATRTAEGYPAPTRAILVASKPA
jgi:tRNA (mo5U34)-methyltransferase